MIRLTDILVESLLEKKEDRCKRIADRRYDKPSAYKSGAIVRCRKGDIWKDLKEDNLEEAKQAGVLYHWTSLKNLEDIIKTNIIRPTYSEFDDEDNGVSLTRSKNKHQFGISEAADCVIVLDGDKLSNNYKIKPYNDLEVAQYDDFGVFDEMEERLLGSIKNLNKYVIKIILYKSDPKIESLLKEKNIPYELNLNESLYKWFKHRGGPGKEGGWIDCNTCREVDGKTKCKPCGRKEGEKRAKYPSCRPTPAGCKQKGKGKTWGKTK